MGCGFRFDKELGAGVGLAGAGERCMVCGGVLDELLGERGHDIVRSGTSERSVIKNRCVSGESGNVGTALGWASCCLEATGASV